MSGADTTHPGGDSQHTQRRFVTRSPELRNRADETKGQLLTAVGRDLGETMTQRAVRKPPDELLLIRPNVEVGGNSEHAKRLDHERAYVGSMALNEVGNVLVSGQQTEIRNSRMRAVQKPQLQCLVRRDVIGENRANQFPGRAGSSEVIFDHPLRERFRDDRTLVVQAEKVRDVATVARRRRRHNAIDDGRRKADAVRDPRN